MLLFAVTAFMVALTALTSWISRSFGRSTGYVLAGLFLVPAVALVTRLPEIVDGVYPEFSVPWIPQLGVTFSLRLDALSLIFAMLVLGVGSLIMAYCSYYLNPGRVHRRLYVLLVGFAASMMGLVLADDLVLLYVCWELTSLLSFLLIGGQGTTGSLPAIRSLVITVAGGMALMVAVVLMIILAGTSRISQIIDNPQTISESPMAIVVGVLIAVAAMTKSAQLPFHFWLPGAMVALTPVSAYLHAATMVKAGIYLLMLVTPIFAGTVVWHGLIVVGLLTAIVGAVFALQQHDLKALLAYSTVSQLGFMVALIGVGTPASMTAAILFTVAHALFKATLFMLVGIIDRQAGSRDIRELEGLRKTMPRTAVLTGLAAMSLAGLPPMLGFISKEAMYDAFIEMPGPAWVPWLAAAAAVCAATLTFAYGARLVWGAFGGRPPKQSELVEPGRAALIPTLIPAAAGLLLGVGIGALYPVVAKALGEVVAVKNPDPGVSLWHGLTVALALTAVTVTGGMVLFFARDRVGRVLSRLNLHFTGAGVFDRAFDGSIRVGRLVGVPALATAPAVHLAAPLVVLVAAGMGGWLVGAAVVGTPSPSQAGDYVVAGLISLAVLALLVARSRLAAVALLGVVGFAVALFFMLAGAPDLVLTQILIEILTVVVAVLVLRRLPLRFPRISLGRRAWTASLATLCGLVAAGGTWAMTSRRDISDAGSQVLHTAPEQTGGSNAVNVVLVDFRAFDTLGEVTVIAFAAFGVLAMLVGSRVDAGDRPAPIILRMALRVFEPALLLLALYLLLRGHSEPGGGFIAALVVGAAVALRYLTLGNRGLRSVKVLRAQPLLAIGLLLAVGTGAAALLFGTPFLSGAHGTVEVPGVGPVGLTTALVFDLGVLFTVVALIVAALNRLGART